jgi:hypothetical protein
MNNSNVIELSKKRGKNKKTVIDTESYLTNNPKLTNILRLASMEFSEKIHELIQTEDKDVSAKVVVSFEFFRE